MRIIDLKEEDKFIQNIKDNVKALSDKYDDDLEISMQEPKNQIEVRKLIGIILEKDEIVEEPTLLFYIRIRQDGIVTFNLVYRTISELDVHTMNIMDDWFGVGVDDPQRFETLRLSSLDEVLKYIEKYLKAKHNK